MPQVIDTLFERLKQFDEVTLLELLNITTEDIIERFRDKIVKRKDELYGEVELFDIDDEELEGYEDEFDGYQIESIDDDNEEETD